MLMSQRALLDIINLETESSLIMKMEIYFLLFFNFVMNLYQLLS